MGDKIRGMIEGMEDEKGEPRVAWMPKNVDNEGVVDRLWKSDGRVGRETRDGKGGGGSRGRRDR